jgi:hypothetical protein
MNWGIEFVTAKFLPTLPEDCQINPGRYGFELALWLAQALSRQGIVTSYPNDEDWAWFLDYEPSDELNLTICCASCCSLGAGYDGQPIAWTISIRERRSMKQRIRTPACHDELEALGHRIMALLHAEDIEAVKVSLQD